MNADTIVLIVLSVTAALILYSWHRANDCFDLRGLLVDSKTKQVSLSKVGQLVALLVSTWVLIYETRAARLTEWLFTGYMAAWALANLANKWIKTKADNADK